ncbi:MAG TPA: hypothetical protein VI365_31400 [Trebonia sp.]
MREGTYFVQGVVRARSVALRLGFAGDEFSYAIDFGLPAGGGRSAFALDPETKREASGRATRSCLTPVGAGLVAVLFQDRPGVAAGIDLDAVVLDSRSGSGVRCAVGRTRAAAGALLFGRAPGVQRGHSRGLFGGGLVVLGGDQRCSVPFCFLIGPGGEFGIRGAGGCWVPLHASVEGWVESVALAHHASLFARQVTRLSGVAVEELDLGTLEPVPLVAGMTDVGVRVDVQSRVRANVQSAGTTTTTYQVREFLVSYCADPETTSISP